MGILGIVRKMWTNHKLRKGRCTECSQPLPDDAADRFCSDECAFERKVHGAY